MDKNQKHLTVMEVKFWQNEAKSCEERQKIELIQKNNYPFLINYYEGIEKIDALYPHVSAQQQYAIINEYFPNTNALISEIVFQNPDILLEATKPDAEEDSPLMKSALNYFWDKAEGLIENRVALFDMLYAGYCAIEVDIIPKQKKESLDLSLKTEEKPQGLISKTANAIKKALNLDEVEETLAKLSPPIEANFATAQGTYIRRYDPLDVPLDWRAERVKDRRYNLKKIWLSKAEFDIKYPEFAGKISADEYKFEYSKHDFLMHNSKVLLYEFQARMRDNQYLTIVISPQINTSEIDMFIRPYTTNGFNMKIGTLHKYGKLYPCSIAQINKKMQDEMNHYVRHLMDVAERNVPKYLTDKNKVKVDGKEALRSNLVNDIVEVDGNISGAVTPLQPTQASYENKELLAIFQNQKNKLWTVSESRISGKSQADFATELAIQDSGFKTSQIDIQEGLRFLIQQELETGKDLIVSFFDEAVFLKVTGHSKMKWYEPKLVTDPNNPERQIVLNPLSELLTADYEIKIDIASAGRKNRDVQLKLMTDFILNLVKIRDLLQSQGKDINVEEIVRVSKEFGWNPDKLLIDFKPAEQPSVPAVTGETISPEEDARRQAEAEARAGQKMGAM